MNSYLDEAIQALKALEQEGDRSSIEEVQSLAEIILEAMEETEVSDA